MGTAGSPTGLTVSGDYAYVAESTSGIQVFDVSEPTSPHLESTLYTAGAAAGVTVKDGLA